MQNSKFFLHADKKRSVTVFNISEQEKNKQTNAVA
jgi:hypothetical protein